MDNEFDRSVSDKIKQVETSPVPSFHLNKEAIWRKIENSDRRKLIFLNWKLVAAASVFIILLSTGIWDSYQKQEKINELSSRISRMKIENQALLNKKQPVERVLVTMLDTVEIITHDTVFVTKTLFITETIAEKDTIFDAIEQDGTEELVAQTEAKTKLSVSAMENLLSKPESDMEDSPYPTTQLKNRRKLIINPNEGYNPNLKSRK